MSTFKTKSIYDYKILYIFATLIFFRPGVVNFLSPTFDMIYKQATLGFVALLIILCLLDRKHIKVISLLVVSFSVIIISTYMNNLNYEQVIYVFMGIVGFCIYCYLGINHNLKLFIKCSFYVLAVMIVINLILFINNPDGLFITDYYGARYHFFGNKNNFLSYIFPELVFVVFALKLGIERKIILFSVALISVITIVLSSSSSSILVVFFYLFFFYLDYKKDGINKLNYNRSIFIYLCLFFLIVIFRLQRLFSFIIEDILKKSLDFSNRTEIWDVAISMVAQKPFIGYGADFENGVVRILNTYYYGHNLFLEIMLSGGVTSLFFFILAVNSVRKKVMKTNIKINSTIAWITMSFSLATLTEAFFTTKPLYLLLMIAYCSNSIEKYITEHNSFYMT
ncbi:MAG: O-antigen ligase family protein [Clostridiaceae bacterium]